MNRLVRSWLLTTGEVVTFRQHKRKKEGRDWATDKRGGKKICDIEVRFIREVNKIENLNPYVEKSGFLCGYDWIMAIRGFIGKGEFKGYLYHVKKI